MSTPPKFWQGAPWTPRKWQARALPIALAAIEESRPVIRAVTGAGKSILIAELAHVHLKQHPGSQVVITTPSVNLVEQLSSTMRARGLETGCYYTAKKDTRHPVIVACNDSLSSLSRKIGAPGLWVADECHKTECDQIKDVVQEQWVPARRVGFTATPYRADQNEVLSLFDALAFDYDLGQAIQDGAVVPPKLVHYDGTSKDLNTACAEMILEAEGPGLVDSLNITDAREFADTLGAFGVRAKAVHSRLHDSTVSKRLRMLERGDLDCVVHVSMLSEGVDLPWLRWLCCRRPISSRVLFAQYVGRGLRTHADEKYGPKKHCLILDPQDLFEKLDLDYDALLSGLEEEEDERIPLVPALEVDWVLDEIAQSPQDTLRDKKLKALDPTTKYVRRTHLALQCMGRISMKLPDAQWRLEPATDFQLRKVLRLAWVVNESEVPAAHRRALICAIKCADTMKRGTVADLISILKVLEYGWPNHETE